MSEYPIIIPLKNEVKYYNWGHKSAIYDVLQIESPGKPGAELWMGAHPDGSSIIAKTGEKLIDVIA